jgi:uncharacterized protein
MLAVIDQIPSIYLLAILFFGVALIYSSVGMGGGSSYTAIMAILSFNVLAIPLISLILNLLVTTIGSVNFMRNHHARFRLILPFLISSIPMAYLGGAMTFPVIYFEWILLLSLILVAARIYLWDNTSVSLQLSERGKLLISLVIGSILGLIAGIVGIGGGVYLVPVIIILGLGTAKEAAACGAIFIWLNSISGLVSRLQFNHIDIFQYWPLLIAVFIGGSLGSYLGSFKISSKSIDKLLGIVVLIAIVLLGKKLV